MPRLRPVDAVVREIQRLLPSLNAKKLAQAYLAVTGRRAWPEVADGETFLVVEEPNDPPMFVSHGGGRIEPPAGLDDLYPGRIRRYDEEGNLIEVRDLGEDGYDEWRNLFPTAPDVRNMPDIGRIF